MSTASEPRPLQRSSRDIRRSAPPPRGENGTNPPMRTADNSVHPGGGGVGTTPPPQLPDPLAALQSPSGTTESLSSEIDTVLTSAREHKSPETHDNSHDNESPPPVPPRHGQHTRSDQVCCPYGPDCPQLAAERLAAEKLAAELAHMSALHEQVTGIVPGEYPDSSRDRRNLNSNIDRGNHPVRTDAPPAEERLKRYADQNQQMRQTYSNAASGGGSVRSTQMPGDRGPYGGREHGGGGGGGGGGMLQRVTGVFHDYLSGASINIRDADVPALIRDRDDLIKKNAALTSAQRGLNKDLKSVQDRYNNLMAIHRDQKKQLEKERTEKLDHQKRVNRIAAHIDNKELFIGLQLSDENVISMFRSLWGQVKSWTGAFSCEDPIDKKPLEENGEWKSLLSIVAPGDPTLKKLDKKKPRREFVQGLVGFKLAEKIFRRLLNESGIPSVTATGESMPWQPVPDLWSANHATDIGNLEGALFEAYYNSGRITAREYNDWRAFTVSLVSRLEIKDEQQAYPCAIQYASELMDMVSGWAKRNEPRERLERGLISIFQKGIEMALEVRKQRACWTVDLPYNQGGEFSPSNMEDLDGDEDHEDNSMSQDAMDVSRIVELYVFPALYKRGNADGDHYDEKICLVKGLVKCRQR